jgi:hypothetical protein
MRGSDDAGGSKRDRFNSADCGCQRDQCLQWHWRRYGNRDADCYLNGYTDSNANSHTHGNGNPETDSNNYTHGNRNRETEANAYRNAGTVRTSAHPSCGAVVYRKPRQTNQAEEGERD